MSAAFFITGTDTGVGKTHVTAALLRTAAARGLAARGMKPVASGCERTDDGYRSHDALALIDAMSDPKPPYARVNPYALEAPLSPNIAARQSNTRIDLQSLIDAYRELAFNADFVAVEGVGGWCVPFSDTQLQAELVRDLGLPVVLVVGVRLGCINHALLTARAVQADGFALLGWIANHPDDSLPAAAEAVATIANFIGAPLGEICRGGRCEDALLDAVIARANGHFAQL